MSRETKLILQIVVIQISFGREVYVEVGVQAVASWGDSFVAVSEEEVPLDIEFSCLYVLSRVRREFTSSISDNHEKGDISRGELLRVGSF